MADEVTEHLKNIEDRLSTIADLLVTIGDKLGAQQPATSPIPVSTPTPTAGPVQPPPVVRVFSPMPDAPAMRQPRPVQPASPYTPPTAPVAVPAPAASSEPKRDAEYVIGARLLPWAGSILVVLGLICLVAWGFVNGHITKQEMFAGEVLFAMAFVVLGQRLRGAREQFGQLLTGVGLAGLYLVVVGGHIVYRLYDGSVLVGLSTAVSLSMLALSWVRAWPSLWVLGLIGGFYSSTLPMNGNTNDTGLAIHLLTLVAGAILAVRLNRAGYALTLWVGSLMALVPVLRLIITQDTHVLATMLADGLICIGAFSLSDAQQFVDLEILPAIAAAMLSICAIRHNQPWFVLAFSALLSAIALLPIGRLRNFNLGLGIILAAMATPWCFSWHERALSLCALGGLFAVISLIRFRGFALVAAILLLANATGNQFVALDTVSKDVLAAAALATLAGFCLWAVSAFYSGKEAPRAIYGSVLIALLWFLVSFAVAKGVADPVQCGFYMSASWAALAAAAEVVGFRFKFKEFRYWGFAILAAATIKVLFYDLSSLDQAQRVAILLALGLLMLAVGYVYVRQRTKPTAKRLAAPDAAPDADNNNAAI
jgi:uncharacterized membrane protein